MQLMHVDLTGFFISNKTNTKQYIQIYEGIKKWLNKKKLKKPNNLQFF